MSFEIDPSFRQKILAGFPLCVKALENATKDKIIKPEWQYPRETKRKNNSVVGSPRDIVDLGTLRDSLFSTIETETSATVGTKAEYSFYVHQGYFTQNGTEIPSRPYLVEAFVQCDKEKIFEKILNDQLKQ